MERAQRPRTITPAIIRTNEISMVTMIEADDDVEGSPRAGSSCSTLLYLKQWLDGRGDFSRKCVEAKSLSRAKLSSGDSLVCTNFCISRYQIYE
jgi:hypothetical protein